MTVIPFPEPRRRPIDDPGEIAAVEHAISAIAGLISATGGQAALAGRDLYAMSAESRALLLTDMYDSGEVVFGWRDGRSGEIVNVALERLVVTGSGGERPCWRAEIYVEEADGHRLRGAYVEGDAAGIGRRLTAAANDALGDAPLQPAAALAAFLRRPE